jgi:hypothetical protein
MAALSRHGVTLPIKRRGLAGKKSLTQRYCDCEYRGAAGMMLEVFEHFSPGWIDARRLARLPPCAQRPVSALWDPSHYSNFLPSLPESVWGCDRTSSCLGARRRQRHLVVQSALAPGP